MTKTAVLDQNRFLKQIDSLSNNIRTMTISHLKSLMQSEASSSVNANSDKILKDFKSKVHSEPSIKLPDEVYKAVMNQVVSVEAPNISEPFYEGQIIKLIGTYVANLLDTRTKTINSGGKTYEISSPLGASSSIVSVTIKGKNNEIQTCILEWNDDKQTAKKTANDFMDSAVEFIKSQTSQEAIFVALTTDVAYGLIDKWIKVLGDVHGGTARDIVDRDIFKELQIYIDLERDATDEVGKFVQNFYNKIDSLSDKQVSDELLELTQKVFTKNKATITKVIEKYRALILAEQNLTEYLDTHAVDADKISSLTVYKTFMTACNDLGKLVGASQTNSNSLIENSTRYNYSDVHNEIISESNAFVKGTSSGDTITANNSYITISSDEGNDNLVINGANVWVYAGDDDDGIIINKGYVSVIGGKGKDLVSVKEGSYKNYISTGEGNDSVLFYGSSGIIEGGAGAEVIVIASNGNTAAEGNVVYGGSDNDTILINGSKDNTINGDDGNDVIGLQNGANNNTVIGGKGNDTITLDSIDNAYIFYSKGDGNDVIVGFDEKDTLWLNIDAEADSYTTVTSGNNIIVRISNGESITLNGSAGKTLNIKKNVSFKDILASYRPVSNEVIFVDSKDSSINNTLEGVQIKNFGENATIHNYGNNVIINGGIGNNIINNLGNSTKIYGDTGNDNICNYKDGKNATIDGGTGNDTIYNTVDNVTIYGGDDDDSIENGGNNVAIDGGGNDDEIHNWYGDNVKVDGGTGNDSITNGGNKAILNGNYGNDTILNDGNNVTIYGGNGNDVISHDYGYSTKVYGGAGNDSIYNYFGYSTIRISSTEVIAIDGLTIDSGDGNDYIQNDYGDNAKIYSGKGNDYVYSRGNDVEINDPYGNNYIHILGGDRVTINLGNGMNSIENIQSKNSIINTGNGNDSIYSYQGYNLTINAGTGDDTIINENSHNATINGGLGNDIISLQSYYYSDGSGSFWLQYANGDGNDTVYGFKCEDTIQIDSETYTMLKKENDLLIKVGNGYITFKDGATYTDLNIVSASINFTPSTSDTFEEDSEAESANSINLSDRADSLDNNLSEIVIEGFEGDDSINNFDAKNKNVTINGGEGNDVVSNWASKVAVNGGDGDDALGAYQTSGNVLEDVTIDGGNGNDTITNYSDYALIKGGTGSNYIHSWGKNVTVVTEGYNDTVDIDSWNTPYTEDVIMIGSNGGDVLIRNYKESDVVVLPEGVKVTSSRYDWHDYLISIGDRKLVFENTNKITVRQNGEYITFYAPKIQLTDSFIAGLSVGSGAKDTYLDKNGTAQNDSLNNYNNNIAVNGLAGNDTINNRGSRVSINGGDGADEIYNDAQDVTINAGIGNDAITNNGNGTKALIELGQGNDSILNFGSQSTIYGGAGNDVIVDMYGQSTINGGTGNDNVTLYSSNVFYQYDSGDENDTVYGFDENDTLLISGSAYSTNISGNDVLVSVSNGSITLKDAKDISLNIKGTLKSGSSNIISLTSGNDSYTNTKSNITIDALAGNDSIDNESSGGYVVINSGSGSDHIINYANNVTINSGDDSDYIFNTSSYVVVDSGSGNDRIINWFNSNITMSSGAGDDYIESSGEYVVIDSGEGNDVIESADSYATLDGGAGNDTIYSMGYATSINGDAGNDSIKIDDVLDVTMTVAGGTGNDTINNIGDRILYQYTNGDGNDIIYGVKTNDTLQISGSKYTTTKSGSDLIVGVGNGKITLVGAANTDFTIDGTLDGGGNSNPLYITGTSGADYIYNTVASATIFALAGDDSIQNFYGDLVSINADDGNDYIEIYQSSNVTINAGVGNDDIYNVESNHIKINAGSGDDYIDNIGSYVTIDGGNDNDFILNELGDSVSINGGKGNDSITTYGYYSSDIYWYGIYVTVNGGAGNDLISLSNSSGYAEVQYASGDGNDIIYGINSTDSLKISGAKYSTVKSGTDIKVNVGNGSILLKDAANLAVKIIGTMESGSVVNETLQAGMSIKSSVLTASTAFKGNRINLADYEATKVNASALTQNVTIIGSSAANSIKSGKGADIISGVNGKNTISGGSGNDSILGGSDNDKLLGETGNDTLNGGSGNDTLTGGAGVDVFVYDSGNDLITDYKSGEDKIKIGTITNSTVKGSDVILTTGNDNLTIKGAKDKVVTLVDNSGNSSDKIFYADTSYTPLVTGLSYDAKRTILTAASKFSGNLIDLSNYLGTVTKVNASALTKGISIIGNSSANNSIKGGKGADTISGNSGKDTITGGNGNDLIFGGADNDKLLGEAGNDTLNGGTGNDTLTGGAGQDIFIYSGGNDIITDYKTGEDKIKLNPSAITSSSVKGSDVVLTTNNGTLTVKGAKDKVITFVGDNGSITEKIFYANISYSPLETGLTYDAKRIVLTASNKFKGDEIDLGEYLGTVTKINATAPSQALNIVGNSSANSIKAGKGADTINGGSGKDTIFGGNGNDSILGGVDNDLLKGDAGNDTLNGGTGNDTLTGGAGNDVFVYEGGSDTITDYKSGEDKIKLSPSSITSSTVKGSDVILTTSNGTLTVKATKDKVITFVGNNGRETDKIFFANTSYEPLATGLTYDAKRTVLTSSNKFTGSTIDLGEYLGTATKINAAANSQSLNIIGNSSSNSIKAGKGADTISGGKGNDTLTGGGGSDVFIYEGGNDIITDYTSGQDTIKVSGTIFNVSYNGKNVIFSIGTGSLTVINAKGKDISVTDSSNKIQTYSRTLELLYDNNFMTNEFGLDEITEVTETNYSVGQMEYSNDNNDFIINSVVSDSSFNKK